MNAISEENETASYVVCSEVLKRDPGNVKCQQMALISVSSVKGF